MLNKHISNEDLIIFFSELNRITSKNVPINEALRLIASDRSGLIPGFAAAIEENLRKGMQLSEAISNSANINPYAIALLKTGETSGALGDTLEVVVSFFRKTVLTRRTLTNILLYPVIVISVFIMINIMFAFSVVPKFSDMFVQLGAELPAITMMFVSVYAVITHHFLPIAAVFIILLIFYTGFRKTLSGRIFESNVMIMLPLMGKSILMDSISRFCGSLGILLRKKVPVDSALLLASASVENLISKKAFGIISERLAKGGKLSDGFRNTGIFSSTSVWLIEKSEERGDLDEVLLEISQFYENRFEELSNKAMTLLEPILIVCIGLFVGIFAVSMFLPLFSIPKIVGGQ